MRFTKMEGLGNDYVYMYHAAEKIRDIHEFARRVSDRHFGIGSDGLVLIEPSDTCDFRMRMFNSDGSEAEMCGNASRCIGKYVYDNGYTDKTDITLETKAGVKYLTLFPENGKVAKVTVDMGEPVLQADKVPAVCPEERMISRPLDVFGNVYEVTAVSMGNPHAVIFVDSVKNFDVCRIGKYIEHHEWFPARTNVEFVEVEDGSNLHMRVWERGAGETLACGTGACATLVASVLNGKCAGKANIHLIGGTLEVEWNKDTGRVCMTGTAETVFEGELLAPWMNDLLK